LQAPGPERQTNNINSQHADVTGSNRTIQIIDCETEQQQQQQQQPTQPTQPTPT
jgi:hypothetical protein